MDMFHLILVALVAALAGIGSVLDSFQTHRPLIVCTLLGLVLGDVTKGIIIGASLEIISIGWMNIGASVAPDTALAGCISAIIVILGKQDISSGIAIAIPVAIAGQILAIFAKTVSVGFLHWGDKAVETGNFSTIDKAHISALILHILRVVIPVVLIALAVDTTAVQDFFKSIPPVVSGGLGVAGSLLMVVGYAMIINMIYNKQLAPFLFVGFVISSFLKMTLVGYGILGLCLAILYVNLPKAQAAGAGAQSKSLANLADDELED